MANIKLSCACGEVQGEAVDLSSPTVNRVICCCSDCQAFANHLASEAGESNAQADIKTLDEFGGTDLVQMPQAHLKLHKGQEHLRAMRLKEKGLLRFYAGCCNTPIGNTVSAKMPFIGVIHTFINEPDLGAAIGPVKGVVQTQHAIGEPTYEKHSAKFPIGITLGIIARMLYWKVSGKGAPTEFFGEDGRAVIKPTLLNSDTASA